MVRVHIICEGQTEERFVKALLNPHFENYSIYLIPRLIGKTGHKGGRITFERLKRDIANTLKEDKKARCTTFFDYYRLPRDFPGKAQADKKNQVGDKALEIEKALTEALGKVLLNKDIMRRFIPYVQMYEFEALLFSDVKKFVETIDRPHLEDTIVNATKQYNSPEEINEGETTHPSARIKKLIPNYQKPTDGILAAKAIGLETIRQNCLLFDAWLKKIEQLATML